VVVVVTSVGGQCSAEGQARPWEGEGGADWAVVDSGTTLFQRGQRGTAGDSTDVSVRCCGPISVKRSTAVELPRLTP